VIHGQFFNGVMMLYVVYMIMGEHTRNKVLLDALPPDRKANVFDDAIIANKCRKSKSI
jgi:hypothetical protein